MRTAVLAAWLFGLASVVQAQTHPEVVRAENLERAGRLEAARSLLDSLLATDTLSQRHRAECTYLRGVLSQDPDAYERRLLDYVQHFDDPPQAGDAELRLGRLAYARRQLEEALRHFDRAIDLGRTEEGNLWKGLTASVLGQTGSAEECLSKAAASGNAKVRQRALMAWGDLERRSRDFEAALGPYRKVREEAEPGPGWWSAATLSMAGCYHNLEDVDEEQRLLREILTRSPASYEAALCRNRIQQVTAEGPAPEQAEAGQASDVSFSVQMGAFSLAEYAAQLADSLRVLGYPARVATQDDIHRVMVGRYATRDEAAAAGDSLDAHFKSGYEIIESGGR